MPDTQGVVLKFRDDSLPPYFTGTNLNIAMGIRTVANVTDLEALTNTRTDERLYLLGYDSAGDGGGGVVYRVSGSSTTRDGIDVFTAADGGRFFRDVTKGPRPIEQAGVRTGNTAASNLTRLSAALNSRSDHWVFSSGDYPINNATNFTWTSFEGTLEFTGKSRWVMNTNNKRGPLFQSGTGARFLGMSITYSSTPTSRIDGEGCRFNSTTDTHVEDYSIDGSTGAGLLFSECIRPRVIGCTVRNTMADGLHFANCEDPSCSHVDNYNTGDDGLAFVNYAAAANYTGGRATNVKVVQGKSRGIVVVGQSNVVIENFEVDTTFGAGVLVQYDAGFASRVPSYVKIGNGIINNAGQAASGIAGQPSGIVYDAVGSNVSFENIHINNPNNYGVTNNGSSTSVYIRNVNVSNSTSTNPAFNLSGGASLLVLDNLTAENTNGWGFVISGNTRAIYNNLMAINTAKTVATNPNRAMYFDSNTHLAGGNLYIMDTQGAATGYKLVTWPANTTTQFGYLGNVIHRIPNGTYTLENNSSNLTLTVFGN